MRLMCIILCSTDSKRRLSEVIMDAIDREDMAPLLDKYGEWLKKQEK